MRLKFSIYFQNVWILSRYIDYRVDFNFDITDLEKETKIARNSFYNKVDIFSQVYIYEDS